MNSLFFKHDRLMDLTPMKIVRQWAHTINWNARLLSIRGPKGVGKSTMMCQYIKQQAIGHKLPIWAIGFLY